MKKLLITMVLVLFTVPTVALADGKTDYKIKCASCHGANANLLPKMARLLKVDPKKLALKASQLNKEEMIAVVEKGRDKMPSFVKDLAKQHGQSVEAAASQFIKQFRPTSLLQRFASVEEIANMVIYVASKEASATNGAALRAEGGIVQTIA